MRLVCLVAFKNSGKSTFFEILRDYYDAKELMLSDHLKTTCSKVFGIDRKYFYDDNLKDIRFTERAILSREKMFRIYNDFDLEPNSKIIAQYEDAQLYSPRHITQLVGTEILRTSHEAIHIEAAMKNAYKNGLFVTMDLRFQNEFEYFKKNTNAVFVYIERTQTAPKDLSLLHKSESDIHKIGKNCDFVIPNNSSKIEYLKKIMAFAEILPHFHRNE